MGTAVRCGEWGLFGMEEWGRGRLRLGRRLTCCLRCLLPPLLHLLPLSLQAEYKDVLNRAVRQQQAEASSSRSAAADAAADDAFLKGE
jgi:hypothetical protein